MENTVQDHNIELYHRYVLGLSSIIYSVTLYLMTKNDMVNIGLKISLSLFLLVFISTAVELFCAAKGDKKKTKNDRSREIYKRIAIVMEWVSVIAFCVATAMLMMFILLL